MSKNIGIQDTDVSYKPTKVGLNDQLNQIINGYVMGDGYLSSTGNLTVDQGSEQKKFVEWLFEQLKPLCTEDCKISEVIREPSASKKLKFFISGSATWRHLQNAKRFSNPGKITKSYRFNTRNLLKDYRDKWYQQVMVNGELRFKKKLPDDMKDLFTPLFISVWFACDGTKVIGSRGAKFEVTALSFEERKTLKNLFQKQYGIDAVINRQGESKTGNTQWALVINAADYDKFRALITRDTDLIENLFPYKLHPKI